MAWCLVMSAVCQTLKQRWEGKENLLSQLPGYAELSKNGDSPVRREVVQPEATDSSKGEARYCGQLFQHSIDRQVKRWKKANCSTLLRRITRLKCVNSEIKSNVGSYYLERYSPKGSCHLDEPTWVTHLLRTAFRIVDMECIVHAKNQQNRHDETYDYILNL